MEDIDSLKHHTDGPPRYRLSNANVFVSPNGFHYIDYLDAVDEIAPEIDGASLSADEISYIERQLQSNEARFDNQVAAVKRFLDIKGKQVLDIGCGGGLFLSKMRDNGAEVIFERNKPPSPLRKRCGSAGRWCCHPMYRRKIAPLKTRSGRSR